MARSKTPVGAHASTQAAPLSYSPAQKRIIGHRKGHLQVVACAGSGKTETVSARVAALIREGAEPSGIIAFTFTNAAADALKARILKKVAAELPDLPLDRLSPMFVGTIHSYCLRFLQERVPRYAAFDLFEDHRIVGLLNREYFNLGLHEIDPEKRNRTQIIDRFLDSVAIVENEMLDLKVLPKGPFRTAYQNYLDLLDRYHVLTHDQCIRRAAQELERPDIRESYQAKLRHLIVDEFQDINPAQARLIELLGSPPVQVCVVGDDDQAIYQWRGSSVEYIRRFQKQFRAERETLAVNRRSRENIVQLAARFAERIPGHLDKDVQAKREGDAKEIQRFVAPTAQAEANLVADAIRRMHESGIAYRDIAILLRSVRTAGIAFLDALDREGVPYKCTGRTGLFFQPEAEILGCLYAFLAGRNQFYDARQREMKDIGLDALLPELQRIFSIPKSRLPKVRGELASLRESLPEERDADLVGSLYRLLRLFGVHLWILDDENHSSRLGTLARFSQILADFESVHRRARRIVDSDKEEMRGGLSGGQQYLDRLANYISFYAQTEYEDFAGEQDFDLDAVTVTTIHGAKGLEWPVVFVPSLSARRFPSSRTGKQKNWLLPRSLFPAERYEGSDADERRLFYVAMTRARDFLYLSTHQAVTTQSASPSPYFVETGGGNIKPSGKPLWVPKSLPPRPPEGEVKPTFSFSELAQYLGCPLSYRYRLGIGFQPPAAKELGYGKAIHHVLRRIADLTQQKGKLPKRHEVEALFEKEFYLPYADKPAYEQMRARANQLVGQYLDDFAEDFERVWEVERAFELHLDEANISGRADVILDREEGTPGALAIVDYKTRADPERDVIHELQLAVYAAAAQGEGFNVRACYLHDLSKSRGSARQRVTTSAARLEAAKKTVSDLASGIRRRDFEAKAGPHCQRCDVRHVCRHGTD